MPHRLTDLLKTLRRALWRFGIYGERLTHERREDGAHRLALDLRPDEVTDDLPRASSGPMPMGRSVGASPDGEKK